MNTLNDTDRLEAEPPAELLESSPPAAEHHMLLPFVGEWEGTSKTWFEAEILGDESTICGTMRTILGGRFLVHEYAGSLAGYRMDGLMLIGYNILLQRFESAWVDTCHNGTAIMNASGHSLAGAHSLFSRYPDAGGGPPWSWRTELVVIDADTVRIRMYNVAPEGGEYLAVETSYCRKTVRVALNHSQR